MDVASTDVLIKATPTEPGRQLMLDGYRGVRFDKTNGTVDFLCDGVREPRQLTAEEKLADRREWKAKGKQGGFRFKMRANPVPLTDPQQKVYSIPASRALLLRHHNAEQTEREVIEIVDWTAHKMDESELPNGGAVKRGPALQIEEG